MEKYCSNCGKKLEEGQNICMNCGVRVNSDNVDNNKIDKFALVGFILGLVSIIAWIIPLFGYPIGICGIVFSAKGLKSSISKNISYLINLLNIF